MPTAAIGPQTQAVYQSQIILLFTATVDPLDLSKDTTTPFKTVTHLFFGDS
jgi:hypothetical protein